jgi:hypothetical protein
LRYDYEAGNSFGALFAAGNRLRKRFVQLVDFYDGASGPDREGGAGPHLV